MRQWGQTHIFPLCGETDETRDHLFFACPSTFTVWTMLMNQFLENRINHDWSMTVASFRSNRLSKLVKMAFQASIYWIWREKNGRRHLHSPNSVMYIARTVRRQMQKWLKALQYGSRDEVANDGLNRWNTKTVLP